MTNDIQNSDWSSEWTAAAEAGLCIHCGNGLGKFWNKDDGPFCCRGCKGVYHMLHQEDLCRYYELQTDSHVPAANLRSGSFNWLDQMLDEHEAAGIAEDTTLDLDLDIQGVHCAACVWLIEELFKRQKAGILIRINPTLGKVELRWDLAQGDLKVYLAEVEKFGYRLGPSRKTGRKQSRALLMRMAISISMAMNVMMFSLSFYFGLAPDSGNLFHFFGWLSLAMATVSLLAGGGVFLKGAIAGLRRRVLHLDVPISLGMILAWSGSTYGFLTKGPSESYFDSLTIFIALMLVGRWSQEHILERNRNSLLESSGAENLLVKKLQDNNLQTVSSEEVCIGDELWIAPGDLLPVTGMLMRRATVVSLDWITGESDQIAFQPGETIAAGAFNASQHGFTVTAMEDFQDSRLQDLLRGATTSDDEFRPQWWHKINTWYVSLVLAAATVGFLGWVFVDPTIALKVTISVLVVTCPCALGLANPLAEELIHFALRRSGVFLRKQSFLEKALSVRKILLDKTGTLTMGDLNLDQASHLALIEMSEQQQAVLFHMTIRSNHPVSSCLATALRKMNPQRGSLGNVEGEELEEIPGSGLQLLHQNNLWKLGNSNFTGCEGSSPNNTVFALNGSIVASFMLNEEFKADAADEVATLQAAGYDVFLLSGDSQQKVTQAGKALGISPEKAIGGLNPEAKAAQVRLVDQNDTLMVGDGLNDSPSFEAALCAATPAVDRPVLPGKADFFFLGDGIAAIRRSLFAAKSLRKVFRHNLLFAIFYNIIAVGLCLAGLVTPVVAAIIMPLSSITIVSWTAIRLSPRRLPWTS